MNIAILHPQCRVRGGAIKMALLTAQSLKKQGHQVVFYTFEHDSECFPELQEGLTIVTSKTTKRMNKEIEQCSTSSHPEALEGKIEKGIAGSDNIGNPGNRVNSHPKFDTVDIKPSFWNIFRRLFPRAFPIISIAWDIRQVDIVIANNPPMQIVAVLAKFFSLFSEYHQRLVIIWWHHHVPWYYTPKQKEQKQRSKIGIKTLKGWFERHWIIPNIKYLVATSHYTAFCIEKYCGRKSTVIHPVIVPSSGTGFRIQVNNTDSIQGTSGVNILDSTSRTSSLAAVRGSEEPSGSGRGMTGSRMARASLARDDGKSRPVVLFSHGRLEPGKGFDTLVKVWKEVQKMKNEEGTTNNEGIKLIIAGEGSLKNELESQGAIVISYHDGLLEDLQKTENDILAVYLSTIDAFGMAPLEAQLAGLSAIILDKGGARETVLLDNNKQPMAQLIDNENEILPAITYFIQQRQLHKRVSNVNFCHHTEYFTLSRLDADIRSLIDSVR